MPPVALRKLDRGNLRDGIPLVRGLKAARQKAFLADRLLGEFWIDAGGAEIDEFLAAMAVRRLDDIRGNHHVLVKKIARVGVVRENAADMGRREQYNLRAVFREPALGLRLVFEIDLGTGRDNRLNAPRF